MLIPHQDTLSWKNLSLLFGPLAAVYVMLAHDLAPGNPAVTATAAVAIWMSIWWITEALPLAITAMLPLALFPLLGIMDGNKTATAYINSVIFLFIGGFLVAMAMERSNLHRRMALRILSLSGTSPVAVVTGFMLTTTFLSMWISNTATAMMMLPVAMAVIRNYEEALGDDQARPFAIGLLLAIAYSASIGGMATLIGTPPNLTLVKMLAISFEDAPEITFTQWLVFALPVCIGMSLIAWSLLYGFFLRKSQALALDRDFFREQRRNLGPMARDEIIVAIAFTSMALLWIFRSDISLGSLTLPGWSKLFANPAYINDGTVSITIALLLFLVPAKNSQQRLLDGKAIGQLPWDIILLFGGGFALANGFIDSGLSAWLADEIRAANTLPLFVVILLVCFAVTFLSELASNTAIAEMFLPIMAAMGVALHVNPLILMIPASLAASFSFMLPVATPPNAIVFGTGRLRAIDMAKTGIFVNLIGIVFVTIVCWYWLPIVFDFDISQPASWAILK